jgi:hypothetical protein
MITKENLKEVLQTINYEDVQDAIASDGDFILLECHTFNVGSFGTIEGKDYDEDIEREANDNGQLFCSKDDFLMLCDEVGGFEY